MADSGIYEIVNLRNGKRYVGSAVNISKRWAEHRRDLRQERHHSRALLRAWRKYGEAEFEFRIIEKCAATLLIEREQAAIDQIRPEYNCCPRAGSSLGYRHTEETRQKVSERNRRRYASMTGEERQAAVAHFRTPESVRKAAEGKVGKKRGPMPDEVRQKLSASKRGRPNLKNRGRIASEETRQKIREARAAQVMPIDCMRSRAKLTDDQVREILARRRGGEFCGRIGQDFGLRSADVSRICLRQRYAWVDPETPPITFPKKGRGGWKHKPGYRTGGSQLRSVEEGSAHAQSLFTVRGQKP